MKKILLIFAFIFAFIPRVSAQTGQIGTGTGTSVYLPIYSYYGYNYSQQIYTAAEMTTAVGTNNLITAIRFYVNTTVNSQSSYNTWKVYMGNTTQANFASDTNWVPVANLQQVYSANLPTMTNGTWVELPLASPFIWDGTSNVVIAVNESTPGYSDSPGQAWGSYNAGANRGILYREDTTNPNPAAPPSASSRYSDIPRVQLVGAAVPACTTAVPANISVSNIGATGATVSWNVTTNASYQIRYRTLPAGTWTVVNIPAYTGNYTIPGLTESTQYEVEVSTVCAGTQGSWSTAVPFTTTGVTYCTASGNSADEFISNVTVTPLGIAPMVSNSTMGTAPFYSNYTNDASRLISLYRNTSNNNISISKTWPGTNYSCATRAWIDFNRNGVFEASEMIVDDPSNTNTPITANFAVPAGAYAGNLTLRMRVIIREGTSPDACGTFSYGEVEDYSVKLLDLPPCSNVAPTGLAVSNLTTSTATLSWMPALGATYSVQWRAVTTPASAWTTVTPAPTGGTHILTGLNEQVQYEFRVAYICSGVTGNYSTPLQFTTPALTYCTSNPTSTFVYEYMSNVTVNSIGVAPMVSISPTPPPFYSDYTNDAARLVTLIRGTANNSISITRVWPGSTYSSISKAWIDYNRNGIFENSEVIINSPSNTNALATNTFNVPAAGDPAMYGGNLNVRMRVILSETSTSPNPCGTFSYGEVEDYSVKLIDLQPCSTVAPIPAVSNLTSSSAYVTWMPTANATYRIRWRQGTTGLWQLQPLGYVELPAGQSYYTIANLLEQTAYQVQIQAKCGTTWGAFGASVNFTTPSLTYCNMTGTNTIDHISNVKVTPVNFPVMDNTSVQTNYISYTTPATLINLEVGSVGNQISVSKAWAGSTSTFADAVDVYIDWNRNGVFEPATERIMNSASSTTTPVTATFNVPATVYTGNYNTTMRVILRRGSTPVLCQDPVNGEVEDYAVKLRPCATTTPTNVTTTLITQNSATIGWTSALNNNSFVLEYRAVTTPASPWITVQASALAGNPPVLLTGLVPATLYEVRIAAKCGAGTLGAYTPIKQFTTRCDPTPPNVTVTNVTSTSAVVTWNPIVPSATYLVRYRVVGTTTWINVPAPAPPANSVTLTGLSSYVTYEVQVANQCVGETTPNPWSNPQVFTTVRVCEIPPPGLTITTLTPTSAEVVWDAFTGAGATGSYILRYRKVGIPSWTTINVNTNTYTLTGLLELTKYEMQVANVCSGTPGNFTPPYYFTTPTVVYCQMSSTTGSVEFINKVTVKPTGKLPMINETLGSTYSDFTGPIFADKYIEMIQGSTGNQITVDKTVGTSTTGVAVWIDFNRNGSFDLNERIMADGPNINPTATATFNVPADAFVSMTDYKYVRMRVAMSKDAIPVNCLNFQNGEVEDYTVRISKPGVANVLNQTDILIYPNPVSTVLNVKNISKKANYKIYSAAGQVVSSGLILNNKIDVSRLINGVYVIDIEDVQGTAQKKFIKE